MPIHWREDLQRRWPIIVYSDPFIADEWDRAVNEILSRAVPTQPLRLLVDRRYCAAPLPEFMKRVVTFAERHAASIERGRVAVVTHETVLSATPVRVANAITLHPFNEWAHAGQWLQSDDERQH